MYLEGKTNQWVSKAKKNLLKAMIASCHTCFSNIYTRIMRLIVKIKVLS